MSESFSRQLMDLYMEDLQEEDSVMDVLREILETERSFHGTIRFLQGDTRNHLIAAQMRNTGVALHILRTFMDRPPAATNLVMNIDLSGNMLRGFLDPVPVLATPVQIAAATESHVTLPEGTTCSICQESVQDATRLRACGHSFHASCIGEWLGMNTRCPMCRHDIRETYSPPADQAQ